MSNKKRMKTDYEWSGKEEPRTCGSQKCRSHRSNFYIVHSILLFIFILPYVQQQQKYINTTNVQCTQIKKRALCGSLITFSSSSCGGKRRGEKRRTMCLKNNNSVIWVAFISDLFFFVLLLFTSIQLYMIDMHARACMYLRWYSRTYLQFCINFCARRFYLFLEYLCKYAQCTHTHTTPIILWWNRKHNTVIR